MKRLLLIACLAWQVIANAQIKSYTVDTVRQVHDLKSYCGILAAPDISKEMVLSGKLDDKFSPYRSTAANLKNTGSYWIFFRLHTVSPVNSWRLVLKDSLSMGSSSRNDFVDIFILDTTGRSIRLQAGLLVPLSQKSRDMPAGMNAADVSLEKDRDYKVYLQVRNIFPEKAVFSFPAFQHPSIPADPRSAGALFIVLNAIALTVSVLSFFFYFFTREKSYLIFALYTFFLSQHYTILDPNAPFVNRFIPEHPHLVYSFWWLFTSGGFILFCLFGRYFMNLAALSRKIDRLYLLFLGVWAFALGTIGVWFALFSTALLSDGVLTIFGAVGVFGFVIRFAFFRSILAKLFVGGALWLFVFTALGILWGNGIIFLPFNPWPVGQVGQLLIYAAGLAYKVRLNEKARAEAARIQDMDEIRSRFFANISHEFRTPLTLIQGPLQQIEENVGSRQEAVAVPLRHIRTMRRNTDRLMELVNQLLDLSKLDSGKMKLQVSKGDVLQLIKSITMSFEAIAERKAIHYHVHFREPSFIGFFDKDKMEKIISNLLANAFKFTPEGGTVAVEVDIENERLRVSVEDSGVGIPKKALGKIFDRFYQLEGTEDKGTGIGLALVKELVNLYRGQITVNSEPAKGSRFRVTLPVYKSLFREEELIYSERQGMGAGVNWAEERDQDGRDTVSRSALPLLLLAEDNAELRAFIKEVAQEEYQVIETINGEEAFRKAVEEIPDMIVSDVMMPLVDGFELAQKIKTDERTSHIPLILLTAKAGREDKMQGLTTGADDYLIKPFDAAELMTRMRNLVRQRKLLRKKYAADILMKPSEIAASSIEEVFLQKLMQAIEKKMGDEDFGVEELAKEMAMSRSQLHRKLVAIAGQTPSEVLRNARLLRAKELLEKKSATPSEVAFQVGFSSHAYFSKCFKEEFGVSPSEV